MRRKFTRFHLCFGACLAATFFTLLLAVPIAVYYIFPRIPTFKVLVDTSLIKYPFSFDYSSHESEIAALALKYCKPEISSGSVSCNDSAIAISVLPLVNLNLSGFVNVSFYNAVS